MYVSCLRGGNRMGLFVKMKKPVFIKILLSLILFLTIFNTDYNSSFAAKDRPMRDMTANEIVNNMGVGWNLGNTLDGFPETDFNYIVDVFYQDFSEYTWNKSNDEPFYKTKDSSAKATLSWDMGDINSVDNSKIGNIGIRIMNFNDRIVPFGTKININISKADIRIGKNTYSVDGLLGKRVLTMNNGIAEFGVKINNKALINSGQLKEATFNVIVEIDKESLPSKIVLHETTWGNPLTTSELLKEIKSAGFNAVRVPVTWFPQLDSNNRINKEWLDRVEEIVNYVLENDMYCIINVHHDTGEVTSAGSGWLDDSGKEEVEERFIAIWQQVADRFKAYDDYLLFESYNELFYKDSNGNYIFDNPSRMTLNNANKLNQIFVDTVRGSGGNNKKRYLVVPTCGSLTNQATLDGFVFPKDLEADRLIISIHDYSPLDFSWYTDWIPHRAYWGDASDKAEIDNILDRIDKRFTSQGIPVILGEFSSANKNNLSYRIEHADYIVSRAKEKGITCFWWDTGGQTHESWNMVDGVYSGGSLYERYDKEWIYPEIAETLVKAAYGRTSMLNMNVSNIKDQFYTGKEITPNIAVKLGSKKLVADKDYSITYSNNIKPGKALVTIEGIGAYIGRKELVFNILPSKVTIKSLKSNKTRTATVTWNKADDVSGYQIVYSTNKNGTYRDAGETDKSTITISNLKKGTTYYIKARAYKIIEAEKLYGSYSDAYKVVIK